MATSAPTLATFPGRNGDIVFALSRQTEDPMEESCTTPFCGYKRLYALNPRTGSASRIPTCVRLCEDVEPGVGPRGRRIVFRRTQYTPPGSFEEPLFLLASANRDGTDVQTIDGFGRNPAWAPSGVRFAYEGRPTPNGRDVYIYDERLQAARRLTFGGGSGPDWSSRGRIAFTAPVYRRGGRTGRYGLYSVWPNGRGLRLITSVGFPILPSWSPSGRVLAYTDLFGRKGIYTIRADGTRRRRLTRRSGQPVWSPDGKRIAFNPDSKSIMVMKRDGSGLRRLYKPRDTGLTSPLGRLSWSVAQPYHSR